MVRSAEPSRSELVGGRTRVSERLCASPPQGLEGRAGRGPQLSGSPTVRPTPPDSDATRPGLENLALQAPPAPAARGSRARPRRSRAEPNGPEPGSSRASLGSPPPPVRKCPSAVGRANRASATVRDQVPKREAVEPVREQKRKWPKGRRLRPAPRGCRGRGAGRGAGRGKMAASRRGEAVGTVSRRPRGFSEVAPGEGFG